MIASVRGIVSAVGVDEVVVIVGGIGLAIQCTPSTVAAVTVGQEASLATALVVREDSLTLYGFADVDERECFHLLQTVTGVGPRLAQAVIGTLSPEELRRAVHNDDLVTLMRVPGVGRKGAQRMVLDLKDRIGLPTTVTAGPQRTAVDPISDIEPWRTAVRAGLTSLGWSTKEADTALDAVAAEAGDEPDIPALLRSALRSLDRR